MSHHIEAFIGHGRLLRSQFACCCSLIGDLFLVPVEAVSTPLRGEEPIAPFRTLTPSVMAAARSHVAANAVLGYIETEYFGGIGEQRGTAWCGDTVMVVPEESRGIVNTVLRALGVERAEGKDEWDTVDLVRYRSNEAIVAGAKRR